MADSTPLLESPLLESYVAGAWFRAADEGAPLHDAATGEEVARISSSGIDLAAMTDHARNVGGPALRELTFHERAGLLKAMAKHLTGLKDELYELSYRTGATRRDSMVDIDGGIGTVFSYGSKGTRELPNDTVVLDGARRAAGSRGHLPRAGTSTPRGPASRCRSTRSTSRSGASWRSSLLPSSPGCPPSSSRPARRRTSPSWPYAGSSSPASSPRARCSCSAAVPPDCSRSSEPRTRWRSPARHATGAHLRQHPSVLHGGVRLGVEADSLNCSILGPDVTADDPEFDLFVKAVVTEMTVKAGQKCTAIRRTIVPAGHRRRRHRRDRRPAGEDHRRQPRRRRRPDGRAREHPPARGGPQGGPGPARLGRDRLRRPRPRRGGRRRPGARRVHVTGAPACAPPTRRGAARRRAVRTGLHRAHLRRRSTRPSRWPPAARASLVGSAGHARPGRRARGRARPRAVARPHPGARPRRRRRVHRPRLAAADARARRPRSRRRRRGARRHPRRAAPHAAHRDPGLARHADRDHRPVDDRLRSARRPRSTRSARAWPTSRSATPSPPSRARSASRTSSTSRTSPATPSTPTPTPKPRRRTRCSAASWPTAT